LAKKAGAACSIGLLGGKYVGKKWPPYSFAAKNMPKLFEA
jgi:hypothetical protein